MCFSRFDRQHVCQRWTRIRSQDSVFFSDTDPESKICEKPDQESLFIFGSGRRVCMVFINVTAECRLHRQLAELEQESDSQIWKNFGPSWTGTESEMWLRLHLQCTSALQCSQRSILMGRLSKNRWTLENITTDWYDSYIHNAKNKSIIQTSEATPFTFFSFSAGGTSNFRHPLLLQCRYDIFANTPWLASLLQRPSKLHLGDIVVLQHLF